MSNNQQVDELTAANMSLTDQGFCVVFQSEDYGDKIFFCGLVRVPSSQGNSFVKDNGEFYPEYQRCQIAFSDGSLLEYDGESKDRLRMVYAGDAFLREKYVKMNADESSEDSQALVFVFDKHSVDWIVCGDDPT